MIIAFDCDGTLIDFNDQPRTEMVLLAKALRETNGMQVIIWSGGGKGYAERVMRQCFGNLKFECFAKFDSSVPEVDIAFDDDTMVRGVRTLLLWKKGDLPVMEPLGDCAVCLQNKDEWDDHDFVPCEAVSMTTRCKQCGMPHRVYKATHIEDWGHSEQAAVCDECAD